MLPLDSTCVDYSDRLEEALRRLCEVNDWSIEQLASGVLQSRSDLLLIRADQTTSNESMPIRQVQKLLSGSVDMLVLAARATIAPKAYCCGGFPDLARDFLDHDLRMGHARRGSFVLTSSRALLNVSGRSEI